jgi:two-component system phosphate regulon response regulator OmpR
MSQTEALNMIDVPHLLVVDDDTRLRDLLQHFLTDQGFRVTVAADADAARHQMQFFEFDVMVLDVMMPKETGLQLAAALPANAPPVLMLTAMGEAEDRITGLEVGARDYLVKPFEPRELVLRLRNLLSSKKVAAPAALRICHFGPFQFDLQSLTLSQGKQIIYLTSSEAIYLKMLAEQSGQSVSRETLAELHSGAQDKQMERSVDVQINRLRKKIEPVPGKPIYIQTVRGAGYVLHARKEIT